MNTIAKLWNGNLAPIKYLGINNQDIQELESLIQSNYNHVLETADIKTKENFEKFKDCFEEYLSLISEQSFCDGYALGSKLLVEALTNAETITKT
ncbi:MAG: hypothetical protein E7522_00630 [Ruminococcaceae bacterium]|nr:hypothetical protein [Oscillospiraceae bacterium]